MSSDFKATTSSQSRKYQGYPYVNPPVFGVPSIDPHTAARWANLPRRPLGAAVRVEDLPGCSGTGRQQADRENGNQSSKDNKQDAEDNPVVYVDIPDSTDNSICEARYQDSAKTPDESISYRSDDEPVLYIDLPGEGESDMYVRSVDTNSQQDPKRLNQTIDKEDEPVVYIDLPECSGSGVSERRPEVEDGPSTSVVQETIFYDQFKDRRIDVPGSRDDDSSHSSNSTIRRPRRPAPPTTLNLCSPGSAGTSSPQPTPNLPSYLTPQEYELKLYRRTPEDEFRLPPLPVTEFPDPPPAYSEIDLNVQNPGASVPNLGASVPTLGASVSVGSPVIDQQPVERTRVIINESGDSDRKFMTCEHCQNMVQSLVVRQVSLGTHLAAICCLLFGIIPCTVLIYCCDCCKSRVHYCPNCNQVMSTENPFKLCC